MYTIKEAAARTGLSVPVLRAWQRRYAIVEPARTESGYRLYDDAAIERLRAMRSLVEAGWSPSLAAEAIRDGTAPLVSPVASMDPAAVDRRLVTAFVEAAARLDTGALERVLDEMSADGTFESVAERHLLPALHALGDAWAAGIVDVAGEHAASQAVQRRLSAAFQAAASTPNGVSSGQPILVGLPPGARHEFGALTFAVGARRAGLPILYLGPDLPTADWLSTAVRTDARAAVIGVVSSTDGQAAAEVAEALAGARSRLPIAFGGAGAASAAKASGTGVVLPDGLRDAIGAVRLLVGADRR